MCHNLFCITSLVSGENSNSERGIIQSAYFVEHSTAFCGVADESRCCGQPKKPKSHTTFEVQTDARGAVQSFCGDMAPLACIGCNDRYDTVSGRGLLLLPFACEVSQKDMSPWFKSVHTGSRLGRHERFRLFYWCQSSGSSRGCLTPPS